MLIGFKSGPMRGGKSVAVIHNLYLRRGVRQHRGTRSQQVAIGEGHLGLLTHPKRVAFKAAVNHGVLHLSHQYTKFFSGEASTKIKQTANTTHGARSTATCLAGKSFADSRPRYSFQHASVCSSA